MLYSKWTRALTFQNSCQVCEQSVLLARHLEYFEKISGDNRLVTVDASVVSNDRVAVCMCLYVYARCLYGYTRCFQ